MLYNYTSTTFIFEPGQDRKVAALKVNERVCSFFGVIIMNEEYMKIAIEESLKSLESDDIPVGAVIVRNDKIISRSFNMCKKYETIHNHAEINCINEAINKTKNPYLDDCVIYVTMEPCLMCYAAIEKTNIKKIVYGVSNEKMGFSKYINHMPKIEIEQNICSGTIKEILNNFFKNKRN